MVTNAKKIDFIQKIKDMQERTKNSKKELLKQIDTKDEDYKIFSSKLKEIQESNHDIFGLMAILCMLSALHLQITTVKGKPGK